MSTSSLYRPHVFGFLSEKARRRVLTGEVGDVVGLRSRDNDLSLELQTLLEDSDRRLFSARVSSSVTFS